MGALGDLLELLHGSASSWESVQYEVREWTHVARAQAAFLGSTSGDAVLMALVDEDAESSATYEQTTHRWVDRVGDRQRTVRAGHRGTTEFVRVGPLWWSYTPELGAMSNEGDPKIGHGDDGLGLMDGTTFAAAFALEPTGTASVAGRAALTGRATSRGDSFAAARLGLPRGAETYDFAVDTERGVLLRVTSSTIGEPFAVIEVTSISFDGVDPSVFTFVPPEGEEVRPVGAMPRPRRLNRYEGAREVPFPVFLPTRTPDRWVATMFYTAADRGRGANLTVRLADDEGDHVLAIHQSPAPHQFPPVAAWEQTRCGEHDAHVRAGDGQAQVRMERSGTHIWLVGQLDLKLVLDIAAGLAPPPPPPPLVDA